MNDSAAIPPSGEPHWAIIYLREDIQDLRQEIRQVNNRVDTGFQQLNNRIDTRFNLLLATMIGLSAMLAGLIKF